MIWFSTLKSEWASDLWLLLETDSVLESDLRDAVDWVRKRLVELNAGKNLQLTIPVSVGLSLIWSCSMSLKIYLTGLCGQWYIIRASDTSVLVRALCARIKEKRIQKSSYLFKSSTQTCVHIRRNSIEVKQKQKRRSNYSPYAGMKMFRLLTEFWIFPPNFYLLQSFDDISSVNCFVKSYSY